LIVLLACLGGMVIAACSSTPTGRTVASLPGTTSSANATASSSSGKNDQDIVNYTRCLRAHGLNEPDPRYVQHNGYSGLAFQVPPTTAVNQPALTACNHWIASMLAAKHAGADRQLARWLPSLVRYAQCMRSHDISMLDPGSQGELNLGHVPGISNDIGRYTPQFRAADSACRHLLPAGVHDDGTGP
jgi:hypothetical protein